MPESLVSLVPAVAAYGISMKILDETTKKRRKNSYRKSKKGKKRKSKRK